ncbi:translation initiation factor IF-2 [Peptoniphilus catoniae]|uniref:translation initiation factor IF-2 n=1 Tax=Peptoniphilus catoniae TaxID=1660341 RepID=UPI0010FEF9FC|nr:translation initiation factor IF-2 [Peptoniphilus catoniae]
MLKIRVHALAKELGISSKELILKLKELNIEVKNHMSNVEGTDIDRVRALYTKVEANKDNTKKQTLKTNKSQSNNKVSKVRDKQASENKKNIKNFNKNKDAKTKNNKHNNYESETDITNIENKPNKQKFHKKKTNDRALEDKENRSFKRDLTKKPAKKRSKNHKKDNKAETKTGDDTIVTINLPITVKEFAKKLNTPVAQVITKLIGLGIMANQNQDIDEDTCILIADDFGKEIKVENLEEIPLEEQYDLDFEDRERDLKYRPPVVTVMGHVDHGKTSLLDAIKKSHVQSSEAGGITQHIGAYTVSVNNKKVTFLDTPGHEAFTSMRLRGALITDIAILVVAADDGVMPQTIEAISHAKSAGVPIIVAINKIDKVGSNIERVKQELLENGLMPEEWGGDTIMVGVSAKTKEGIDELLDMILLVAEMLELKANPNRTAVGTVVDAKLDSGKGPMATVLIQKGTLKFGDYVVSGISSGRIRAMTDDKNKPIRKVGPSMPAVILGLSEVPNAGDTIYAVKDEKLARIIAEKNQEHLRETKIKVGSKVSLENLFDRIKEGEMKELNIIVKGDVKGSVEALNQSLMKLSNEEVKINIIHSGVGGINESDISLASASNAIVIGFNVRPNINAIELAKTEEVDIRTYRVIYDIINDIKSAVTGMLEPDIVEEIQGRCEVRQTFKLPGNTIVAGVYVLSGKIPRNSMIKVLRDDIVIHEGEIASLKRFKDDAKELATGFEGGLGINNFNDIKEGDLLESYILKEVKKG